MTTVNTEHSLFLGLAITPTLQNLLDEAPAPWRSLLVDRQDPLYLQKMQSDGCFYLGKLLSLPASGESVEKVSRHICSLLHRLIPAQECQIGHLTLLSLPILKSQQDSVENIDGNSGEGD